jgi:hypothetical protein
MASVRETDGIRSLPSSSGLGCRGRSGRRHAQHRSKIDNPCSSERAFLAVVCEQSLASGSLPAGRCQGVDPLTNPSSSLVHLAGVRPHFAQPDSSASTLFLPGVQKGRSAAGWLLGSWAMPPSASFSDGAITASRGRPTPPRSALGALCPPRSILRSMKTPRVPSVPANDVRPIPTCSRGCASQCKSLGTIPVRAWTVPALTHQCHLVQVCGGECVSTTPDGLLDSGRAADQHGNSHQPVAARQGSLPYPG